MKFIYAQTLNLCLCFCVLDLEASDMLAQAFHPKFDTNYMANGFLKKENTPNQQHNLKELSRWFSIITLPGYSMGSLSLERHLKTKSPSFMVRIDTYGGADFGSGIETDFAAELSPHRWVVCTWNYGKPGDPWFGNVWETNEAPDLGKLKDLSASLIQKGSYWTSNKLGSPTAFRVAHVQTFENGLWTNAFFAVAAPKAHADFQNEDKIVADRLAGVTGILSEYSRQSKKFDSEFGKKLDSVAHH